MSNFRYLFVCVLLMLSCASDAGVITNARIINLMMDKNYGEKVFLELSRDHSSATRAACHDSGRWEYVVDTSTPYGKQLLSVLLMVKAQDKAIWFDGTGLCSHTGIEELRRVEIQ